VSKKGKAPSGSPSLDTNKLVQAYFNFAYNPVYDFTIGQLNRYQELQRRCIGKLELKDDDSVLCVGLGTGNEIYHLLQTNRNINIVGIDFSKTALRKARKKALRLGKEIETYIMNAKWLKFTTGSFDEVLCLHVMDFIEENEEVTGEILRVLKHRGQFVITYPSNKEGTKLGLNLLKDNIGHNVNSGKSQIRASLELLAQMMVGIVYVPLLFRPNRKSYSRRELEAMITQLTTGDFQIEEDPIYQDFIVYGKKLTERGKSNAP